MEIPYCIGIDVNCSNDALRCTFSNLYREGADTCKHVYYQLVFAALNLHRHSISFPGKARIEIYLLRVELVSAAVFLMDRFCPVLTSEYLQFPISEYAFHR